MVNYTARYSMPYIAATQAQKEILHNEALDIIDGLLQGYAKSKDTTAEPGSPTVGDVYILGASPTGTNWAGNGNTIAVYTSAPQWIFIPIANGMKFFIEDLFLFYSYRGAWVRDYDQTLDTAGTNNTPVLAQRQRLTSDTAANGIGFQSIDQIENSAGSLITAVAEITQLAVATASSEEGKWIKQVLEGGTMQNAMEVSKIGVVTQYGVKPGSFTVAGLPSASVYGAGSQIYVSDETGGAVIAFSDGTNWRRVTDRAVVA